ncbi:MAG: hypothetical protein COA79_08615 [Planctomycetota bacterium]|nr:MAG: hypothetical protein COA79_08615 [Planctomycetota bacterium]
MSEKSPIKFSLLFKILAAVIFVGVSGYLIYKESNKYQNPETKTDKSYFSSSKSMSIQSAENFPKDSIENEFNDLQEIFIPPLNQETKSGYPFLPKKKMPKPFFSTSKSAKPIIIDKLYKIDSNNKKNKRFFPTSKSAPPDLFIELDKKDLPKKQKKNHHQKNK